MKTQGRKYSWFATYFLVCLMTMFFMAQTAHAEESSTIIINGSADPTIKPVVRPQKRNPNSKYDVKISPAKPTTPIEGAVSEGAASDTVKGERQRTFPQKSGIAGKIQNKSIDGVKSEHKIEIGNKGSSDEMKIDKIEKQGEKFEPIMGPAKPIDEMKVNQNEKQGGKFEPMMGPTKLTDDESGADKQLPLSERVEVTRVQSWKLDKSGNKTNEMIKDDNTKIKGINQHLPDINPK